MNMQRSLVISGLVHMGLAVVFSALVRSASFQNVPFWVGLSTEAVIQTGDQVASETGSRTDSQEPSRASEPAADAAHPLVQPPSPEETVPAPPAQPGQAQPAVSPEQYRQFMMLHARAFAERAGGPVQDFLDAKLGEAFRMDLRNATALVRLRYSSEGRLEDVEVYAESDALVAMLEQFDWNRIPAPSRRLFNTGEFALKVLVRDGTPFVYVLI